jgi:hypothetical protein
VLLVARYVRERYSSRDERLSLTEMNPRETSLPGDVARSATHPAGPQ